MICRRISAAAGEFTLAQWCKIRYRGYYYDTETGLYWVQTRYYNPDWCRWISPDSISYLDPETPHGLNLYLYCGNDPVNYVDPSGQGFIAAIAFFFICIIANVFASIQKAEAMNHSNAIIMVPSITVKSTPNEGGTDLFILHEGRKVMIKDNTMKEWKEIQLEDGNVGWVPVRAIEII